MDFTLCISLPPFPCNLPPQERTKWNFKGKKKKETHHGNYSVTQWVTWYIFRPYILPESIHCNELLVWLEDSGFCYTISIGSTALLCCPGEVQDPLSPVLQWMRGRASVADSEVWGQLFSLLSSCGGNGSHSHQHRPCLQKGHCSEMTLGSSPGPEITIAPRW